MTFFRVKSKGVSMIEILFVVALMGILTTISVSVFSGLANSQSLDREVEIILSNINRARTNAVNSLNLEVHGVQFTSSSVKIFYGSNPATSATSTTYTLSNQNSISNISLTNGTNNFYFNKLSGEPSATGSITIQNSLGSSKVITIYATGLSDVQ